MGGIPVATRLPENVADHVEMVAENPAVPQETKSQVVREMVLMHFEEDQYHIPDEYVSDHLQSQAQSEGERLESLAGI